MRTSSAGPRGVRLTLTAAAAVIALAIAPAPASAERVRVGDQMVDTNSSVTPAPHSGTTPSPVAFAFSLNRWMFNGGQLPPLSKLGLGLDPDFVFDPTGIPACTGLELANSDPEYARAACGAAIVGNGSGRVVVSLPDIAPFVASGPLTIFNGTLASGPELLFHLYLEDPVPQTYILSAPLAQSPAGWTTEILIPQMVGGYGALDTFAFTLDRMVSVRCSDSVLTVTPTLTDEDGLTFPVRAPSACAGPPVAKQQRPKCKRKGKRAKRAVTAANKKTDKKRKCRRKRGKRR